jgi:hypothetical protein
VFPRALTACDSSQFPENRLQADHRDQRAASVFVEAPVRNALSSLAMRCLPDVDPMLQ